MKPPPLAVFRLLPRPCRHEAAGTPHPTARELIECVLLHGAPGFEVAEVPLRPTVRQRRYRWRARATLVDEFGGFCGAHAPPGAGCGANGRTELQLAHLRPTGLDGRGRGFERRMADVRAHPFDYCLLCPPCHRRFDEGRGG